MGAHLYGHSVDGRAIGRTILSDSHTSGRAAGNRVTRLIATRDYYLGGAQSGEAAQEQNGRGVGREQPGSAAKSPRYH